MDCDLLARAWLGKRSTVGDAGPHQHPMNPGRPAPVLVQVKVTVRIKVAGTRPRAAHLALRSRSRGP